VAQGLGPEFKPQYCKERNKLEKRLSERIYLLKKRKTEQN
jgi:hypothetical protein